MPGAAVRSVALKKALHEKVEALVSLLQQQRMLLVLDGFERQMRAYPSLAAAYQMAETLARSGLLSGDIRTPEQAFAIMAAGAELGIGPMTALRSIVMVKGKITLSSELMLRLMIENGIKFVWLEDTDIVLVMLTNVGHMHSGLQHSPVNLFWNGVWMPAVMKYLGR